VPQVQRGHHQANDHRPGEDVASGALPVPPLRGEKKKLKRLKRRTLISSKKPSNKNKVKYWHPQLETEEQLDLDSQDTQTEVIVID